LMDDNPNLVPGYDRDEKAKSCTMRRRKTKGVGKMPVKKKYIGVFESPEALVDGILKVVAKKAEVVPEFFYGEVRDGITIAVKYFVDKRVRKWKAELKLAKDQLPLFVNPKEKENG